jgi:hypothetical protein
MNVEFIAAMDRSNGVENVAPSKKEFLFFIQTVIFWSLLSFQCSVL